VATSSTTTATAPAATTALPPATTTARAPAPLPSAPLLPLAGKVVVIHPGHNGANAAHAAESNQLVDAMTEEDAAAPR
jgi:N-acetylmuramoyl-L-alanine amidase